MITESQYKDAVAQTGQTRALAPSRQERNNYEAVIDGMMTKEVLERYPMLTDAIKQSAQNPMERRQAILSVLDRDRALFTRINQAINVQTSIRPRERIKALINMLREYVKVGDVEKKQYGEVMTPVSLVEDMMDGLPKEVWSDPKLKWLDPANGCGIFPAVVVARLMDGLAKWQPDEGLRYQHIIENMLYVCELQPKNMFLYLCAFDPKDQYVMNMYTGSFLEVGFQKHAKEVWGVDKFDVIVGNPPYQTASNGGTRDMPLYNVFVEHAKRWQPRLLTMVIPSRWMVTGLGLGEFRKAMLGDDHMKTLVDYARMEAVFPSVDFEGGVCYFLRDSHHTGLCQYTTIGDAGASGPVARRLGEHDILVRDSVGLQILEKVRARGEASITEILSADKEFGWTSNYEGFRPVARKGDVALYYYRGGKRLVGGIAREAVAKSPHLIDKWKVMTPAAYGERGARPAMVLGPSFLAESPSVCTQTYLFFSVGAKKQAESLQTYLSTRLFRFLVSLRKITQHATRSTYTWVPQQTWDRAWTDEELYKKYNLSEAEIAHVASCIRPKNPIANSSYEPSPHIPNQSPQPAATLCRDDDPSGVLQEA